MTRLRTRACPASPVAAQQIMNSTVGPSLPSHLCVRDGISSFARRVEPRCCHLPGSYPDAPCSISCDPRSRSRAASRASVLVLRADRHHRAPPRQRRCRSGQRPSARSRPPHRIPPWRDHGAPRCTERPGYRFDGRSRCDCPDPHRPGNRRGPSGRQTRLRAHHDRGQGHDRRPAVVGPGASGSTLHESIPMTGYLGTAR